MSKQHPSSALKSPVDPPASIHVIMFTYVYGQGREETSEASCLQDPLWLFTRLGMPDFAA
jgi:hypothetical protein